jgi:hypothetical protein
LKSVGNAKSNKIWEAMLPPGLKPKPTDDRKRKDLYIRAKYVRREYVIARETQDAAEIGKVFIQHVTVH